MTEVIYTNFQSLGSTSTLCLDSGAGEGVIADTFVTVLDLSIFECPRDSDEYIFESFVLFLAADFLGFILCCFGGVLFSKLTSFPNETFLAFIFFLIEPLLATKGRFFMIEGVTFGVEVETEVGEDTFRSASSVHVVMKSNSVIKKVTEEIFFDVGYTLGVSESLSVYRICFVPSRGDFSADEDLLAFLNRGMMVL